MAKKAKTKEYQVYVRLLFAEQITARSAGEAEAEFIGRIAKSIHFSSQYTGDFEWEILTTDSNEIK